MTTSVPWPAEVIDPHIHQWDPYRTPRHVTRLARLLRPVPRIPVWLGRLGSREEREFIGDPHHVLKPYLPLDYHRDADTVPVKQVVHIEAAWRGEPVDSVNETRWVSSLPWRQRGAPSLGAIVVHVDPRWERAGELLDKHLSASDRVRGVRHSVARHPDPGVRDFEPAADALAHPDFLRGFAAIAERGLSFELWMYSHQLPAASRLIREYPETTFVLCHYGTPVGLFGPRGHHTGRDARSRDRLRDSWYTELAELAEHPNVVAKHSGLGMPSLGHVPPRPLTTGGLGAFIDRVAPLVQHVHTSFGSDRTMWASNYPIDKPGLTLPATARILLDSLGSSGDPQKLFHDVAHRIYRL